MFLPYIVSHLFDVKKRIDTIKLRKVFMSLIIIVLVLSSLLIYLKLAISSINTRCKQIENLPFKKPNQNSYLTKKINNSNLNNK